MEEYDRRPVVLTVDDDPDQCRMLARMLARDCEVIQARTSYEAINTLLLEDVDYVLTDSNTKEFDGVELCRVIRTEFGQDIAVIFVSASGDYPPMIDRMASAGANGILTKPFRIEDLRSTLRETQPAFARCFPSPHDLKHRTRKSAFAKIQRGLASRATRDPSPKG